MHEIRTLEMLIIHIVFHFKSTNLQRIGLHFTGGKLGQGTVATKASSVARSLKWSNVDLG